jgi:hypothetical protein
MSCRSGKSNAENLWLKFGIKMPSDYLMGDEISTKVYFDECSKCITD